LDILTRENAKPREYFPFLIVIGTVVLSGFNPDARKSFQYLSAFLTRTFPTSASFQLAFSLCLRFWINIALLFATVRFWEKKSWQSIGFKSPVIEDALTGTSLWLFYSLMFPTVIWFEHSFLPKPDSMYLDVFVVPGFWQYTMLFSGILLEELASRGYVTERLTAFTGMTWLAAASSLVFSVGMHIPGRNLALALRRTPLMLLLTLLYLWRRSVIACLTMHLLVDIGLPLIAFHAPRLLRWILLPRYVSLPFIATLGAYVLLRRLRSRAEASVHPGV
jgi:membrane protease YdiL (CAAX protease family)